MSEADDWSRLIEGKDRNEKVGPWLRLLAARIREGRLPDTPETTAGTCEIAASTADATRAALAQAQQEIAKHLSPENENVKRGDLVASIRDLAQVALSERGNAETAQREIARLRAQRDGD